MAVSFRRGRTERRTASVRERVHSPGSETTKLANILARCKSSTSLSKLQIFHLSGLTTRRIQPRPCLSVAFCLPIASRPSNNRVNWLAMLRCIFRVCFSAHTQNTHSTPLLPRPQKRKIETQKRIFCTFTASSSCISPARKSHELCSAACCDRTPRYA